MSSAVVESVQQHRAEPDARPCKSRVLLPCNGQHLHLKRTSYAWGVVFIASAMPSHVLRAQCRPHV